MVNLTGSMQEPCQPKTIVRFTIPAIMLNVPFYRLRLFRSRSFLKGFQSSNDGFHKNSILFCCFIRQFCWNLKFIYPFITRIYKNSRTLKNRRCCFINLKVLEKIFSCSISTLGISPMAIFAFLSQDLGSSDSYE